MTEPNTSYPNGEPVTKERIQDEPWYPNYQSMMEMAVRNIYGDHAGLLRAFEDDFREVFGLDITREMHEKFERWAKCEYSKSVAFAKFNAEEPERACPKCLTAMIQQTDKGPGNGPNGGHLAVMEDMEHSTEGYDFGIAMWKCPSPDCKAVVYISEEQ